MGCDPPLRDRGMHPSLKLLLSLGFLVFLLRKPVWYLLLAPTGWSSSLLIVCWLLFPLQKGRGSKVTEAAETRKGQGNTECRAASGQRGSKLEFTRKKS